MMVDANDVTLVTLAGPITLYEMPDVREKLLAALGQGKPLMIDLETNERRLRRKLEQAGAEPIPAGTMKFAFEWPKGLLKPSVTTTPEKK